MPNAEDFDDFYVSSRRRLVLQTFALTGDLAAARSAVRDAYVAARHHWAKVGRSTDPEGWVRPRAWATAQRRHTVRRWHKERGLSPEQIAVLEALHDLPDVQRRVVVLNRLAGLEVAEAGRELALTADRTVTALAEGNAALADALDCPPEHLTERLLVLDDAAGGVKFPRPSIIRRSGLRRRRNTAVVGSVLVAGLVLGAGAFVAVAAPEEPAPRPGELVSKKMLLTPEQLAPLGGTPGWAVASTNDNTRGDGINTTCQGRAFADDAGLGTWVRTFDGAGRPARRLVQTVEISNSPGAAKAAYETTLGWYAGCRVARIQLVDAYSVAGVGEQAQILRMRIRAARDRAFVVGIARTGSLTTSTFLETTSSNPAAATGLANVLAASVKDLCGSRVAGDCVENPSVSKTLPPPSGEQPGMLAIADLPAIATVNRPWAGTDAKGAATNPAATTCDRANFLKGGAPKAITRTYLIPQARLPRRFGLTETIGEFKNAKAAARFMQQVMGRMKTCPDKQLGSTVDNAVLRKNGFRGSTFALWRLENQVNQQQALVAFWMGIIRSGRYVAQVNLTPVDRYDVNGATFQDLVERARDRLFEVQ